MKIVTLNLVKTLLVLILATGVCSEVLSQRTITGTVTDRETKEPLIGATVVVKNNQTVGTSTDLDGNFSLNVSSEVSALEISYVGYNTFEQILDASNEYYILLSSGQVLDDVVVIGYGTIKREDVTGSLQTVDSRDFNKGAITSPQQLLAGKVPGVAITTGGGPDDGSNIRIRGESSLSALNDPLIVVDGIPLDNNGVSGNRNVLNIINPNDIESMTVLKDASATAIYGSRSSAGVVLITTKKGSGTAPLSVNYNGNISFGQTANRVDVLNADEFREIYTTNYADDEVALGVLGDANTDWQDEIYRTAVSTDHSLSFSGGVSNLPYRASVGYTNMNGLLLNDNFQRYTGAFNLNPSFLNNTLQLNAGIKAMYSNNRFVERGAIGSAVGYDPTQAVYDPEGPYGYNFWLEESGLPKPLAPANPVALLDRNLRDDRSTVLRYIGNFTADYRLPFAKDVRATLNLGYDHSNGEGYTRIPGENRVPFSYNETTGGGLDNTYDQTRINSVLEFYLNYKKTVGDHSFDAMGGYSWQRFFEDNSFRRANAANIDSLVIQRNNVQQELYLLSLFGRVNYAYKDRLLLTVTVRGDATSRFAPENRWGIFPAFAGAYKLIDNNGNYFNSLKFRAGWGITGQQAIGSYYEYQARYLRSLNNARYQIGDEFLNTFRPGGYDRNIKWEETTTTNLGLDFSIVRNKLYGTLDVYERNTEDLLVLATVPAGSNLTNLVNTNIGNMVNRGIELGLFVTPLSKTNLRWDLGFNIAYNYNEITKLTTTDDPDFPGLPTGGISGGVGNTIQIHTVGQAPSTFLVYEQLYDEDGNLLEGQFADRNGDGVVDLDDRYAAQQPAPFYTLGITSNFSYKSFDFSFAGRASLGNYVYNNIATEIGYQDRLLHPNLYTSNVHRSAVDNNITEQANATFSDHFIENASFFRMDHITLGYSFNQVKNSFFRIYATLQNAFIITEYTGLDPEVFGGIDNNLYPRPRTLVFGVSATF